MSVICPSILARDKKQYDRQIKRVADFAQRIQIDLTDGKFAPAIQVKPSDAWWPVGIAADIHLMYKNPMPAIETLSQHKPNMIIVHAEAKGKFEPIAAYCRRHEIRIGVALLPKTHPQEVSGVLNKIDHVLIFSGDLGHYGGHANLDLLRKVEYLKQQKPELEIGWDGGINSHNISQLVFGGVDVLNVGGFIQDADDPQKAYRTLEKIAEETGTT